MRFHGEWEALSLSGKVWPSDAPIEVSTITIADVGRVRCADAATGLLGGCTVLLANAVRDYLDVSC